MNSGRVHISREFYLSPDMVRVFDLWRECGYRLKSTKELLGEGVFELVLEGDAFEDSGEGNRPFLYDCRVGQHVSEGLYLEFLK